VFLFLTGTMLLLLHGGLLYDCPVLFPFAAAIIALDVAVIGIARRQKISFGPMSEQLVILQLPRLAVSLLTMAIGFWEPRSLFLLLLWGSLQLAGFAVYVYGYLIGPRRVFLSEEELSVDSLSSASLASESPVSALKILHLSDLHMEYWSVREEQLLALVERSEPDIIALTGDYFNLSFIEDRVSEADLERFLRSLVRQTAVVACTGSPKVDDRKRTTDLMRRAGVVLMRNEFVQLNVRGHELQLVGVDCDHRQKVDTERAIEILGGAREDLFTVLLFHSPEIMPAVKELSVDLYLCGHTHGGQVRAPFYGALITSSATGKRYEMGRYEENGTTLYVNRGVGFEGNGAPRFRILCPPEAVLWTIRPFSCLLTPAPDT